MESISIIFPTRNRPDNLRRITQSIRDTSLTDVEILVYIDDDDTLSPLVTDELSINSIVGPRKVMSSYYNDCADIASGTILMFCGDDIVFKTKEWDKLILEEFEKYQDKIVFVHGDDGYNGTTFGTHGFLHKKWCECVGYLLPPYFSCDYGDTWINDVSNALNRRVFVPIVTEHMHPVFGKGEWDVTHNERLERGQKDDVGAIYSRTHQQRLADISKLKARMF